MGNPCFGVGWAGTLLTALRDGTTRWTVPNWGDTAHGVPPTDEVIELLDAAVKFERMHAAMTVTGGILTELMTSLKTGRGTKGVARTHKEMAATSKNSRFVRVMGLWKNKDYGGRPSVSMSRCVFVFSCLQTCCGGGNSVGAGGDGGRVY